MDGHRMQKVGGQESISRRSWEQSPVPGKDLGSAVNRLYDPGQVPNTFPLT